MSIQNQLQSRANDQVKSLFADNLQGADSIFLLSPSDAGVERNGGRKGARFAPESIINCFSKMAKPKDHSISLAKVIATDYQKELDNFESSQGAQTLTISKHLNHQNIFHIGGGHDHIFPLLMALKAEKKIRVINIDAHLDTRIDPLAHSGTPFRQFSKSHNGAFELIQLGIHNFANASSNYNELDNQHTMKIFSVDQLQDSFNKNEIGNFLSEKIPYEKDTLTILSLDCDALCSSQMKAVSAVNHKGLSLDLVQFIFNDYKTRVAKDHSQIIGIYEFNPIFDDLGQSGARLISYLLYNSIF